MLKCPDFEGGRGASVAKNFSLGITSIAEKFGSLGGGDQLLNTLLLGTSIAETFRTLRGLDC